jgi:hypothetical protein
VAVVPPDTARACRPCGRLSCQTGLERDADVVMSFYDSVHGGTAGGWSPSREEALRATIRRGYVPLFMPLLLPPFTLTPTQATPPHP